MSDYGSVKSARDTCVVCCRNRNQSRPGCTDDEDLFAHNISSLSLVVVKDALTDNTKVVRVLVILQAFTRSFLCQVVDPVIVEDLLEPC